jgi:hypothetical protein
VHQLGALRGLPAQRAAQLADHGLALRARVYVDPLADERRAVAVDADVPAGGEAAEALAQEGDLMRLT